MQNKVKYLRVILTEKCNLSCSYCHKEGCVEKKEGISKDHIIKLLRCFYKAGISKFKFMGGEPSLREDLILILEGMKDYKDNIDISMITNGLFQTSYIEKCFEAGLKRVNVSIHGWSDEEKLKSIGMSDLKKEMFLNNLNYLISKRKLTKLNFVYLKNSKKDELLNLIDWVNENELVLDILNVLYDKKNEHLEKEYVTFENIYNFLEETYEVEKIYSQVNPHSIPSKRIKLKRGGIINLKTKPLNTLKPFRSCYNCSEIKYCKEGIKAIRLTTDGYLKPCLFRDDNRLNILKFIDSTEDKIVEKIVDYINKL